ncbi:unnamed protein product [Thelazia callipaeda]|uniref:Transmembrane protein 87A n=1 Tax=Thelazia callipaeda TaxID=103827 RepID=A0A0N5D849_THECL|nr:unnamed protein product [Thelazia callipaeda]
MNEFEIKLFWWFIFSINLNIKCLTHLLAPAILSTKLQLKSDMIEFVGFPQSVLNGTEVEIRLQCSDDSDLTFQVQYVIRSSPCDKEFFDATRHSKVQDLLSFYFEREWEIPPEYNYDNILFYKSQVQQFNCRESHGIVLVEDERPRRPLQLHNVKQVKIDAFCNASDAELDSEIFNQHLQKAETRVKREFAGLNDDSLDGGAKKTLSSWHPIQKLPADGIYFLVIKLKIVKYNSQEKNMKVPSVHNLTVDVQWRSPYGYLSAIDYPLLRFYGFMWFFYAILAIVWLVCCLCYWMDILRIQFCIGAVIVAGMIEKGMFYSEYATMNDEGITAHGFIEAAELVSCLKRSMARVLIIIVSLGYGVVKPRLGSTLNRVISVGIIYFVFSAIEALARVSKNQVEGLKQRQLTAVPLVILEVVIFWWIFLSLINTMRTLRMRRNMVKHSVYRHFTNALCLSALMSVIFMCWTSYVHKVQQCQNDWKKYWLDTAFWHIQFCCILVVIMILWRPSRNNQRYAFTPLLDDSEDENDEDELFNTNYYAMVGLNQRSVNEGIIIHGQESSNTKHHESQESDRRIQEELKWIEDNIPSSLVDRILVDDEEHIEKIKLERSKML